MSHQSELIASDIHAYLKQHENKKLLRMLTCGSVDDGKSTLIGRLLHDTKMIYEDQLADIRVHQKNTGSTEKTLDLALLVDGLQAEREQGITIDVAYRYFSTEKRKFIIADTPGHEQYTRNMATGTSNSDLAIILVDARHGVQTQTKRHSFIVSLLGIKHVIVAINKMDLMHFSEGCYEQIKTDYTAFSNTLTLPEIQFVPISALKGDNVVTRSNAMPWYQGLPLMETLETIDVHSDLNVSDLRFMVQYVNRPHQNFRGFAGTLTSGIVRPGDSVTAIPSGKSSTIKSIVTYDGELEQAFPPMSVTLTMDSEIDISRGDLLVHSHHAPKVSHQFDASVIWLSETPMVQGKRYDLKLVANVTTARFTRIHYQIDVNTFAKSQPNQLTLNGIARCEITVETPVAVDDYQYYKGTGAFIIIDKLSNATVAAGMVHSSQLTQPVSEQLPVTSQTTPSEKAAQFGQQPVAVLLTGTCKEVRAGLLYSLEKKLVDAGHGVAVLHGDHHDADTDILVRWLTDQGLLVLTDSTELTDSNVYLKIPLGNKNGEINPDISGSLLTQQLYDLLLSKGII